MWRMTLFTLFFGCFGCKFWICRLRSKTKIHEWQNPDRKRTNQSTGICLRLGLPYNNYWYHYYPLCWSFCSLWGMYLGLTFSWCCLGVVFPQIISANVSTANHHQPVPLDDVELPFNVQFTYSVLWSPTEWVKLWSSLFLVLGPMRPCDVHVIGEFEIQLIILTWFLNIYVFLLVVLPTQRD